LPHAGVLAHDFNAEIVVSGGGKILTMAAPRWKRTFVLYLPNPVQAKMPMPLRNPTAFSRTDPERLHIRNGASAWDAKDPRSIRSLHLPPSTGSREKPPTTSEDVVFAKLLVGSCFSFRPPHDEERERLPSLIGLDFRSVRSRFCLNKYARRGR